ncbi:MAG: acyl-CoA dehydrogenase family protein [Myxococcaceae bacterium]|nr:acyl-CoA dehydrogenase family protein [Myxococcaceae bacterium]
MLGALLESLAAPIAGPTFDAFWRATADTRARHRHPTLRAAGLGARADRLAFAFAGGYVAALSRLDPTLGPDDVAALCATEDGGAHPRAIHTTLKDGRLSGTKRFVSGGPLATRLLVVATTGEVDGRPRLVLVRVPPTAPGVTLTTMDELPFVPELPHASVELRDVVVTPADVLPGDGYADALKPFRTLEDLHVHAAVLGYLSAVARRSGWQHEARERLLASLVTAVALGDEDPRAAGTHLALAGVLATTRALVHELAPLWAKAPADEAARFERDRPLLDVAAKAREARRLKAWETLSRSGT